MDDHPQPATPNQHLESVQRLFVRHHNELRGMVLAILPDFSAVDDVLQETFLTVSRKAADFLPDTNFAAWAGTVARLHALDWRRKQGRWANGLSEAVIERLCAHPAALGEPGHADRELAALGQCLAELAPQARRVIELRYREGHKPAEVARRLGWTAEAIYVALSRSRAALRSCVDRRMSLEGASR
ncbi:MAG: sigma-70 family RNA polymerase sigma factor [Gemmataceae bacterium]|nr:sigma-70 family RNA polymerase sigma factor [Gemmataceae bacterium]